MSSTSERAAPLCVMRLCVVLQMARPHRATGRSSFLPFISARGKQKPMLCRSHALCFKVTKSADCTRAALSHARCVPEFMSCWTHPWRRRQRIYTKLMRRGRHLFPWGCVYMRPESEKKAPHFLSGRFHSRDLFQGYAREHVRPNDGSQH